MRAALGFSIHTGWAAVVAHSDAAKVLARLRIELADRDARFVYHAAAEAAGAVRRIGEAEQTARRRAEEALRDLVREHAITTAALPRTKGPLPALEAILGSHPLLHKAEGELYRGAVEEACRALGLAVVTPVPDPPRVGKMGPPWGKDQKDAAALAWAALRAGSERRG